MKISGSATLHADATSVYEALRNPAVLRAVIPGCESLDEVAPDEYRMLVTVGVGAVKGTYKGEVRLTDPNAPHSFTLKASGAGGPGTVAAECRMLLIDAADGTTTVEYDADAVVGGMVAGVGQRMLTGVAKKLAGQFFNGVDDVLTGKRVAGAATARTSAEPASATPTAVPATSSTEPGAIIGGIQPSHTPFPLSRLSSSQAVLGGAVVGASAALAGVVVGWLMGRRR